MGLFRYEAVDKAGKVVHGAMKAPDERQVAQVLAQKGYALRAIHSADGQQKTTSSPAAAPQPAPAHRTGGMSSVTVATGVPVSVKSIVPAATLGLFFRQLITLVKSGIPLYQSLHDVAATTQNRHLRHALPEIQRSLQSGQKLSGAMSAHPKIFPVHAVASVWTGELAGKLDIALEDVAVVFEQEASDTRHGRIGWGIAKANFLLFILLLWAANLQALIAPSWSKFLTQGAGSVQEVLAELFRTYLRMAVTRSLPIVIALIAGWIAWGAVKRIPTVRRLLDGILLKTPVWGKLHRERALSRFLRALDQTYSAGVSLPAAWDAACLTPTNSVVAERLKLARASCPPDAGVAEMIAASGLFEPDAVGLVASGEKAGQVPAALSNLSAAYADRSASQKPIGRMWSISLLTSSILALSGYIIIKMIRSYFDLMFTIPEILV